MSHRKCCYPSDLKIKLKTRNVKAGRALFSLCSHMFAFHGRETEAERDPAAKFHLVRPGSPPSLRREWAGRRAPGRQGAASHRVGDPVTHGPPQAGPAPSARCPHERCS